MPSLILFNTPFIGLHLGLLHVCGMRFLMQLLCTQGRTTLVVIFRILVPLLFLTEEVSHHRLLMELNGAERLVVAFILSFVKSQSFSYRTFLGTLSINILLSLFYGYSLSIHWCILILSLIVVPLQERKDRLNGKGVNEKNNLSQIDLAGISWQNLPTLSSQTGFEQPGQSSIGVSSSHMSTHGAGIHAHNARRRKHLGGGVQKSRRVSRFSVG